VWLGETGELLWDLRGHEAWATNVLFFAEGNFFFLISAAEDGTARLWDLQNGQTIRVFRGHTASVEGLALSKDWRVLATASADETIRLWQRDTGRLLATLVGHTWRVLDVDFSPDGRVLASASRDGTIRFWGIPLP